MRSSSKFLIVALMLGAAATAIAGGVYRWVDANGKVHYGDQPPAGAQAQQMKVKQAKPAPTAPEAEAPPEPKDPVRHQQCELAKAILAKYEAAPHLLMRRPDGKVHQLTPDEQAKTIAEAKARVATDCNPARPADDLGPSQNRKPAPQGDGGGR